MSAAHVRRGGGGAARANAKKPAKVAVPKKLAKRLPVDQARVNKIAGMVFGGFVLAIGAVVLVVLPVASVMVGLTGQRSAHDRPFPLMIT